MGASSGGAGARFSATAQVPIAFVDNDGSSRSAQLLDSLMASGDFNHLVLGMSEDAAVAAVGKGRIYGAIIVPNGFGRAAGNSQTPRIILYADDSEPGLADVILANLRTRTQVFGVIIERGGLTPRQGVSIISKGAAFSSFDIGLAIILGIVQVFATFYEIAGGMAREREEGTYARLLLTPASLWSVMLGKTAFDSVLATFRSLIIIGVAVFAYHATPRTDLGTILFLSLLVALVTMGLGFVVSAFKVSARSVVIIQFFLVILLYGFSGLIIDRDLLIGASRIVANLLPWSYAFEALRRAILIGTPIPALGLELGVLTTGTIVFYATAYLLLAATRERLIG